MGRRVYQNAMAAYALCLGWGNTPDRFEVGAGKALFDAIVDWSTAELAGTSSPAGSLAEISKRIGLPDVAAFRGVRDWSSFHGHDVVRWDYIVPCPGLNIVVLDTYMWRSYEGAYDNCLILAEAGLRQQIDQALFPQTECSLIVVSNVAIDLPGLGGRLTSLRELGWRILSHLLIVLLPLWLLVQIGLWIFARFAPSLRGRFPQFLSLIRAGLIYVPEYGSDYEHQTKGFELLMARAAHRAPQLAGGKRQSRVVFLSGDVHRSFCVRMEYWSRVPFGVSANPVEGVLAQLVASPCRWVNPTKFRSGTPPSTTGQDGTTSRVLTWTSQRPDKSHWRFKRSPWMMEYVPTASEPRMNPDPEWRYSLQPVLPVLPSTTAPLEIPDRSNPTFAEKIEEMKHIQQIILGELEEGPRPEGE